MVGPFRAAAVSRGGRLLIGVLQQLLKDRRACNAFRATCVGLLGWVRTSVNNTSFTGTLTIVPLSMTRPPVPQASHRPYDVSPVPALPRIHPSERSSPSVERVPLASDCSSCTLRAGERSLCGCDAPKDCTSTAMVPIL
ncbi:hypothetical protein BV20DRAFT_344948 [Pilatotrama ljubarskyi]|nr:hypothetical protein BV20DRAFT_344948 [Pilatotrama ljubarskyi]